MFIFKMVSSIYLLHNMFGIQRHNKFGKYIRGTISNQNNNIKYSKTAKIEKQTAVIWKLVDSENSFSGKFIQTPKIHFRIRRMFFQLKNKINVSNEDWINNFCLELQLLLLILCDETQEWSFGVKILIENERVFGNGF